MSKTVRELEKQWLQLNTQQRSAPKGIDLSNELAWALGMDDESRMKSLSVEALRASEAREYLSGIAHANRNLAYWHLLAGEGPSQSVDLAQSAVYQFQDLGNRHSEATAWDILALSFTQLGIYEKALECNDKSVKLFKKVGFTIGQAWGYHNLGKIYDEVGDFEKAIDFFQKARTIFEEEKYNLGIAAVSREASKVFKKIGQYERAIELLMASKEIWGGNSSSENVGALKVYLSISELHLLLGKIDQAWDYQKRCEGGVKSSWPGETLQKLDFQIRIGLNHGRILRAERKFSEAISSLRNELERQEVQQFDALESEFHLELARNYEHDQQFERALKHQKRYDEIKESILAKEKHLKLENLQLTQDVLKAGQEKETQRKLQAETEKILLQILPPPIVEELKKIGKVTPQSYESATVLFTDFVGFTKIAETMTAEELVSELDFHFSEFDKIIAQHGLEKLKTLGDGYMAVAGIPLPQENHAIQAVKAARELQKYIAQLVREKESKGEPSWNIRIGLNSGPLVAGIIGTQKFAYDVWGNTVNVASRIEAFGEAGCVNLSDKTYELVKDQVPCIYRGEITVKHGKKLHLYHLS